MSEKFFDAAANLLAFGAEGFQFFVELFDFLREAFFFAAEPLNELNGPEDTFLKAGKRISFLVYVRHGYLLDRGLGRGGRRVLERFGGLGDQSGETRIVVVSYFGKNLAIQFDTGQLEAVHKLAVRKTGSLASGIDADDP